MKIKKFNESYYIDDLHDITLYPESSLSTEIYNFIEEFSSSADDGIIGYISTTATNYKIKLTEYKNIFDNKNKLINLANMKKLKNLQKFSLLEKEIHDIENRVEKLMILKNKLLTKSYNELFYKYQEDLLLNDSNNFYNIFLKDSIEWNDSNPDNIEDNIYGEIHPDILKKYTNKIDEISGYYVSSKKFNL